MIAIDCHVHGTRVLLDWSRIEGSHDSPEGPVLDWHCYCGARGHLIAGARSEPRVIDLVVRDVDRAGQVLVEVVLGRQRLDQDRLGRPFECDLQFVAADRAHHVPFSAAMYAIADVMRARLTVAWAQDKMRIW